MLLAYWIVPLTLLLYWARFLTLQQLRGTALQSLLIAAAVGVALYSSTKVGKPERRAGCDERNFLGCFACEAARPSVRSRRRWSCSAF